MGSCRLGSPGKRSLPTLQRTPGEPNVEPSVELCYTGLYRNPSQHDAGDRFPHNADGRLRVERVEFVGAEGLTASAPGKRIRFQHGKG